MLLLVFWPEHASRKQKEPLEALAKGLLSHKTILSSIGLINVCSGFIVIGIVGFPPIATVPIVVSTASALANGLYYLAYYTEYPKTNTIVASASADVFWLIQEAGLSFYSYAILSKMLYKRTKLAFVLAF
ncbi:uncharacterized protein PG986_001493 [Apiospora aurea]|uniref:Uncharacterized protein n=1 Tax=Apiospora aurea TaxID=335848 RepID=A0ABR1QXZ5_9PEZI